MKKYRALKKKVLCGLCLFALLFGCLGVNPVKVYASGSIEYQLLNSSTGFGQKIVCVAVGEKVQIKQTGTGKVSYQISDSKIANIASNGTITGKKEGRTYLTATVSGKKYKCTIAVIVPRLSIDKDKITITEESQISVKFSNRKAKEKLKLSVENNDIIEATVVSYNDDTVNVAVTPKKNGVTSLTIGRTNSVEQIKVNVTVAEADELSAVEIYKKCSKAMVEINVINTAGEDCFGSGFFISGDKVITNFHVIEGAKKISIKDYSGKEINVVKLYDYNKEFDLALLGVDDTAHDFMGVSYEDYKIGERIYTIGSPFGLTGTFSTGIISMTLRKVDSDIFYTQFTAPISLGSSGGPLINSKGKAIGVNTFVKAQGQNLNFAVPSTYFLNLDEFSPTDIQNFYDQNS